MSEIFRYEIKDRGRLPRPRFPLTMTVIERGNETHVSIEENEAVDCVRCGQEFLINTDTAYLIRHPLDPGPYIRCPFCGYKCADVYYYDRVKRPRRQLRAYASDVTQIPWNDPGAM